MSIAHELAWCAGFFDGEGFVTIQRRNTKINGKEYKGHYLRIGVNHVAPEPLKELQRKLGGTIRFSESKDPKRHSRYSWQMSTQAAANALIKMMPYLKNKNKVAALGIEFQKSIVGKSKITDEIMTYREAIKLEIASLNAKD